MMKPLATVTLIQITVVCQGSVGYQGVDSYVAYLHQGCGAAGQIPRQIVCWVNIRMPTAWTVTFQARFIWCVVKLYFTATKRQYRWGLTDGQNAVDAAGMDTGCLQARGDGHGHGGCLQMRHQAVFLQLLPQVTLKTVWSDNWENAEFKSLLTLIKENRHLHATTGTEYWKNKKPFSSLWNSLETNSWVSRVLASHQVWN